MSDISVITPTFNRGHFLPRAWKSLKNQEFQSFEWIVVDDGSIDSTKEVISAFKDERIKYKRYLANRGPNFARNLGVSMASSPFLVFLDSDDQLTVDALKTIIEFWENIDNQKIGAIFFQCIVAETGKKAGFIAKDQMILEYRDVICEKRAVGEFLSSVRMEVFDTLRFSENVYGLEGLFWWSAAREWNYMYIDRPLRIYFSDTGSNLSNVENLESRAPGMILGYEDLLNEHAEELKKTCPQNLGKYHLQSALYYLMANQRKNAFMAILTGAKYGRSWLQGIRMMVLVIIGRRASLVVLKVRNVIRKSRYAHEKKYTKRC